MSFFRCLQTDSWRIVSAGDDKTLKVFTVKSKASPLVIIDPFTVFSTFDMDTLGKIFLHHWKDYLKVYNSTLAKFESDSYVLSEQRYSSRKLCKMCLYGGWLKLSPHHTNICKFLQLWGADTIFDCFQQINSNLVIFLIFKDAGSVDFPKLATSKVEKNRGKVSTSRNQRLQKCGC